MRFSISPLSDGGLSLWVLKDEKTGAEVSVLPGYGALLHSFRIPLEGESFELIDHYKDLSELQKELATSFKGPKLSPFPCRIADGRYQFAGKEYSFLNGLAGDGPGVARTALHGLLYNKSFTVTGKGAGSHWAGLTLEYAYRNEHPGYPHEYLCIVDYVLQEDWLLTVRTTVHNLGQTEIPLADGWHPYFRLGGSVNDWVMQFNADTVLEFSDQLIPTGTLLPYSVFRTPCLIGDLQLDNSFVLEPDWQRESDGKVAACKIRNPANGLSISFFPDSSYPYLQIYIPPGRQSMAVENLSGAPDCFNNEMGLLRLKAGSSQTFTVNYKVSVG
ncbi:MAG: aldose 1-epimerase [Puia sp.]|nr:aldose 1-epimerase [Puia sp.]